LSKQQRFLLVCALCFGVVIGFVGAAQRGDGVLAQDDEPTAEKIVESVGPAVVTVINEQQFDDSSGGGMQPVGSGTGFIIDEDGHIVTNWHVVVDGDQFEVIMADGSLRDAELVGSDQLSDLAIVKIDGDVPGVVELGDSDALKPGQPVLAIGSALGAFTNTVTQGIVSALGRDFPGDNRTFYTNLIQHDAAINPGNSGGPLFNFDGEVIGVNTLGIPTSDTGEPVQGLFFAIPSNTVKKIAAKLIDDGAVVYPYFGIEYRSLTPEVVAQSDFPVDNGVQVITVVDGGPAAEAGIEVGDIITAIGDVELTQQTSFTEALFSYEPGDTVDITLNRDGETMTMPITFAERPQDSD
jgi:S1-C subfamily serine protease